MINNKPAYVQFVSPGQINVAAPVDATEGAVSVVVRNNGRDSAAVSAQLQPLGPAFFKTEGGRYVAAHRETPEFAYVGNPAEHPAFAPARPGQTISLWATGLGPTTPPTADGVIPIPGRAVVNTLALFLAGTAVPIQAAVISGFPAAYQINLTIPNDVPEGDVALSMTVGGVPSPEGVYLFVRR
jgi:uncharacterized protein (TIGR03437 family)